MTAGWENAWSEVDRREWGDNFTRAEIAKSLHIKGWNAATQERAAEIARRGRYVSKLRGDYYAAGQTIKAVLERAERAEANNARLREALRRHALLRSECLQCGYGWTPGDPELPEFHAPGCLAAPLEPTL